MNDYSYKQQIATNYLLDKFINKLTGDKNNDVIFGDAPKDNIVVGMIKAERVEKTLGKYKENKENTSIYESVPSVGIIFNLENKKDTKLKIHLKGCFYSQHVMTYKEICDYYVSKFSKKEKKQFTLETMIQFFEQIPLGTENPIYDSVVLPLKYCKHNLNDLIPDFEINVEDIDKVDYKEKISNYLNDTLKNNSNEIFKNVALIQPYKYKISEILNEDTYKTICDKICEDKVIPLWAIDLDINKTKLDEHVSIYRFNLMNTSKPFEKGGMRNRIDLSLYNAGLKISVFNNTFSRIELSAFKKGYESNRIFVNGYALNCSLLDDINNEVLETTNIPVFVQNRVITNDNFIENASFRNLIENPVSNLNEVLKSMKDKYGFYKEKLVKWVHGNSNERHSLNDIELLKKEITNFEREIIRFEYGIKCIENKTLVKDSFRYLNECFMKDPVINPIKGWRLFQLVFIVSEIPDIIESNYLKDDLYCGNGSNQKDACDVLYFPTGGGKTEAFLGCCVFTLFFDRLRGKSDGVTAMIKYPLRLLSIQQLDRLVEVIYWANNIKEKEKISGKEFSVGYFVGSGVTENSVKLDEKDKDPRFMSSEEMDATFKRIDVCPKCHKHTVQVHFDMKTHCIIHSCTNPECNGYRLPIYTIDDEIYRFLPSIIMGTIDKMSCIGFKNQYRNLFGMANGRCSVHGYYSGDNCNIDGCKEGVKIDDGYFKDPVPTLFIQDELHLADGSLGTFSSHYETFIQNYTENLIFKDYKKRIKYIGATATINNAEDQIYNLYYKSAIVFPCRINGENFYSNIDKKDINRFIIGFAVNGHSITEGVEFVVTSYRILLEDMKANPEIVINELRNAPYNISLSRKDFDDFIERMYISIIFNTALKDSANLHQTFDNQGNNTLNSYGLNDYKISKIDSNTNFVDIKNLVFNIDNIIKGGDRVCDLILATSSISHGVDEDLFNNIFFFGMPGKTSEYIQSFSRVGRKNTGIVVDLIRLARERDRSYQKNFVLFHKYSDRLIDPVPINRWSKNAIYKTLPGIFGGIIFQYYGYKPESKREAMRLKESINNDIIKIEDFTDIVLNSYKTKGTCKSIFYDSIIKKEIEELFDTIKNNTDVDVNIRQIIQRASSKNYGPMNSLRDVDKTIEIKAK